MGKRMLVGLSIAIALVALLWKKFRQEPKYEAIVYKIPPPEEEFDYVIGERIVDVNHDNVGGDRGECRPCFILPPPQELEKGVSNAFLF